MMGNLRVAILSDPDEEERLPALPQRSEIRLVGEVSMREDYATLFRRALPNVIIADLRRRPEQTERIIAKLRQASPLASILVIGAPGALQAARQAMQGGACGYVTRDVSASAIIEALECISRGRMFVSRTGRTVLKQLLDEAVSGVRGDPGD